MSDAVNLTAQEIADHLKIDKQTAYQLVTAMVEMKLAETAGQRKVMGQKGKGATVYAIEQEAITLLFNRLQKLFGKHAVAAPEPEPEPAPEPVAGIQHMDDIEPEPDLPPPDPIPVGPRWEGGVDLATASSTPIIEVVPPEERDGLTFFKVTVEPAAPEDWA